MARDKQEKVKAMSLVGIRQYILKSRPTITLPFLLGGALLLGSCADATGPKARNANIPAPKAAEERKTGLNETGEPVTYLPLGEDVLMPHSEEGDPLPDTMVGPLELRGETLAGALQLILDGSDIPVAFESSSSLKQGVTVTNLKGPMSRVVNEVCSLANMYCAYQNGVLVVKDRQVFTVTIPPIVAATDIPALLTNVATAIGSITGETPITDASTRTIVYRASQRTAEVAQRYFQRLRNNTALIVFETYIWEVALDTSSTMGIKWSSFGELGKYKFTVGLNGSPDAKLGTPVSIGLPTSSGTVSATDVLQFVSKYGAVKTISQPQITVLSGSSAKLRVADKETYLASFSRTRNDTGTSETVSTTTGSADSGFTLDISSSWDNSTVYGTISVLLQDVQGITPFSSGTGANTTTIQLPKTTERELSTQVRVRPGDLLLIGGMVRENDKLSREGPGASEPIIPSSRSTQSKNTELVFLMRPRVVVFTAADENTPRKGTISLPTMSMTTPMVNPRELEDTSSLSERPVEPADIRIVTPPLAPTLNPTVGAPTPIIDDADMTSTGPDSLPTPTELEFGKEPDGKISDEDLQFIPRLADKVKAIKEQESKPSVVVNYNMLRE